ncbi:MAG: zinc ABC transporter substrate-binding protein [Clostridium perfringens]|nr:zinc ABC transporter substrate-binding protein [Clostridium perfringens]
MLKKLVYTCALLASILFVGCHKVETAFEDDLEKVQVVASIDPINEFAKIIGGDEISSITMVKSGVEPHDYEPTSKDLTNLNDSQLFLYNGLDMEEWADKIIESIEDTDIVVVNTSDNVNVINNNENNNHEHGKTDPHIWLSLKECKTQALNIKNSLQEIDGENSEYYEKNYNTFVSQVDALYEEYKGKFDNLENKNFVTSHAAFGYLCRDFGLTQISIEDLFGEGEVTPNTLAKLVNFCKDNNVKTIFMPEVASEKLSETLANEVSAKVVEIYSLETMTENLGYIDAMKKNLDLIYENLSN